MPVVADVLDTTYRDLTAIADRPHGRQLPISGHGQIEMLPENDKGPLVSASGPSI